MRFTGFSGVLALLALSWLIPANARAADSFDSCAGFIDALPATISSQGVWCLRKDLTTAITSGNAIEVKTNNVTIDCNGFKIGGLAAGTGSTTRGVYALDRLGTTVRNCALRGFYYGIELTGDNGGGHLVEDNRLDQSLARGIYVLGDNNLVRRNRVFDTGGSTGALASWGMGGSADFIGNSVSGVFNVNPTTQYVYGIGLDGHGIVARDNIIRGLVRTAGNGGTAGIYSGAKATGTLIRDNHISAVAPGDNNYAIVGGGTTASVCAGNTVVYFVALMFNCADGGGNVRL